MATFDFDHAPERLGTRCVKWDSIGEGELPMWVADMDFEVAPAIRQAVERRAAHPVYGYTFTDDSYYDAVINWFEIETPPGYMSINDTIGDILATTRGKLLALRIVQMVRANMKKNKGGSTGGMADMAKGMKINKSLIDMGKGFTVKRVCMMAGGLFTKEQILEINAKLNKIKKKQK